MEKERLLSHLSGEERALAARVLDLAESAVKKAEPAATDFLDPGEKALLRELLHYLPDIKTLIFGGYSRAERERMVLAPAYFLTEAVRPPLFYLSVKARGGGELGHRDLLGSITGLGIKKGKIGDILPGSGGAHVILAEEVGEYVLVNLNRVGSVAVETAAIDPEQLNVPPKRVKEIKTTVASLRLDAVAGSGFGVSRTKMVREIKAEKVKVNWKVVSNPAYQVASEDTISIRGRGRVIISAVKGKTKKGRISLVLQRLQ